MVVVDSGGDSSGGKNRVYHSVANTAPAYFGGKQFVFELNK